MVVSAQGNHVADEIMNGKTELVRRSANANYLLVIFKSMACTGWLLTEVPEVGGRFNPCAELVVECLHFYGNQAHSLRSFYWLWSLCSLGPRGSHLHIHSRYIIYSLGIVLCAYVTWWFRLCLCCCYYYPYWGPFQFYKWFWKCLMQFAIANCADSDIKFQNWTLRCKSRRSKLKILNSLQVITLVFTIKSRMVNVLYGHTPISSQHVFLMSILNAACRKRQP